MTLRKRIVIYSYIIILMIILGLLYPYVFRWASQKEFEYRNESLNATALCLLLYVHDHHGRFPESREQLIKQGYMQLDNGSIKIRVPKGLCLKKSTIKLPEDLYDNVCYDYIKPVYTIYDVKYGIKCDDLIIIDGKVCDKNEHHPVALIDGLYYPQEQVDYISMLIYKQMKAATKT